MKHLWVSAKGELDADFIMAKKFSWHVCGCFTFQIPESADASPSRPKRQLDSVGI